jgi:hypothetical protein
MTGRTLAGLHDDIARQLRAMRTALQPDDDWPGVLFVNVTGSCRSADRLAGHARAAGAATGLSRPRKRFCPPLAGAAEKERAAAHAAICVASASPLVAGRAFLLARSDLGVGGGQLEELLRAIWATRRRQLMVCLDRWVDDEADLSSLCPLCTYVIERATHPDLGSWILPPES